MERNDNQDAGRGKTKRGFKGLKPQSLIPLIHINSQPTVKLLPKCPSKNAKETEQNLSDFPALPVSNLLKNSGINEVSSSALFSRVLVTQPSHQFASTKVREKKDSKNVPPVNVKKEIQITTCPVKSENRANMSIKKEIKKEVQENQAQNKKVQKSVANISTCRDEDSANSAVAISKKKKKKSKKASPAPQGKVNTIPHEQYVAFTESNNSKADDSLFNTSFEDESEYPVLGQFRNAKVKLKNEHGTNTVVFSPGTGETTEPASPSRQTANVKLEVLSPKTQKLSPNKKFNSPIEMNIMDMLSKMKKKNSKTLGLKFQPLTPKREKIKSPNKQSNLNILDSSGPARKRGKEREVPKKPRLTKMKKVILKERMERRLRVALLSVENHKEPESSNNLGDSGSCIQQLQLQVQKWSLKTEDCNERNSSEVSVTVQPIDVPMTTEAEEESEEKLRLKCAKKLLHCRKFREYCTHFISDEMDNLTNNLLAELVRFQDRLFLKDPVKARARRRLVCGLKEVTKNLKLRKLKVIIIAPDIEEINSEGGLNDALQCIFNFCENYHTPVIFSLPKRKLGKVCKKKVPLSCVGIFNYEGTEEIYKNLMELVEEAKQVYKETLAFAQQQLTYETIQTLNSDQVDHIVVEKLRTEFWESQNRCC